MAKIFRDPLGQEWYAVQIGPMSIDIGEGDYIIFNEENGFQIMLGHVFLEQFSLLHKQNDLDFPEVIILNEE